MNFNLSSIVFLKNPVANREIFIKVLIKIGSWGKKKNFWGGGQERSTYQPINLSTTIQCQIREVTPTPLPQNNGGGETSGYLIMGGEEF